MRDRLTAHYVYYDGQHGYEALGHDAYSQRPFIEITKKLALYEDTGYTPEEVKHLKTNLLGNTADDWMGMYNVAAERAIKAEAELDRLIEGCMRCAGEDDHERFQRLRAEVERLRLMVTSITGGLDEAIEAVHFLEAENAKLRAVVEAARDVVGFGACHDENSFWSIKALRNTIENYEGWKKEGREVNEI